MPISIHVHHGLVDGSHVAHFVSLLEANLRMTQEASVIRDSRP